MRVCTYHIVLWLLLTASVFPLPGQTAVGVLRMPALSIEAEAEIAVNMRVEVPAAARSFDLSRNLIFVRAEIDGRVGEFILDTGAPGLLINHRGGCPDLHGREGLASGGSVQLHDHRVDRFAFADRNLRNLWATGIDLRNFETRTGRAIDGFIGYDLLRGGELRIDYKRETYILQQSSRRPQHLRQRPLATLRFRMIDHLPVVSVHMGKKLYHFVIDTGAGVNLLDDGLMGELSSLRPTGYHINVQGLDGHSQDRPEYELAALPGFPTIDAPVYFLATDLSHLQEAGQLRLAGIIGSDFLRKFTVGIDYRRKRLHLW